MRYDLNAENSIIGSILIDSRCLDIVASKITAEDFASSAARTTFAAAIRLKERGEPVDPVTIQGEIHDTTQDYGSYFLECMEITPTAANVEIYCEVLLRQSNARKISRILEDAQVCIDTQESLAETVSDAVQRLGEIPLSGRKAHTSMEIALKWAENYDTAKKNPESVCCRTGFSTLDAVLGGGMFNDEVYVLAARPGMGKTTLGIGIAENIAARRPVLFVSLEMPEIQIMSKRLAIATGKSYTQIINGSLSPADEAVVMMTANNLSQSYMSMVDTASTVSDIEGLVKSSPETAAVVIDYLGLIQTGDKPAPRYEEVTRISQQIKALAKRIHKPVLVLAQLNRDNTTRSDKRPMLSDLRDSGAIEQDAGGVILLHRENYYNLGETPPDVEEIELIVAKNRHAAPGTVKMLWHGKSGQITEITKDYPF